MENVRLFSLLIIFAAYLLTGCVGGVPELEGLASANGLKDAREFEYVVNQSHFPLKVSGACEKEVAEILMTGKGGKELASSKCNEGQFSFLLEYAAIAPEGKTLWQDWKDQFEIMSKVEEKELPSVPLNIAYKPEFPKKISEEGTEIEAGVVTDQTEIVITPEFDGAKYYVIGNTPDIPLINPIKIGDSKTLTLPENTESQFFIRYQDALGNWSDPVEQVFIHDTIPPKVSGVNFTRPDSLDGSTEATLVMTEEMQEDLTLEDIQVTGGAATEIRKEGKDFVVSIDLDGGGKVQVDVPAKSEVTDFANNQFVGGGSPEHVFDLQSPTVSIGYAGSSPTKAHPVEFQLTFSEEVVNFELADISLLKGSGTLGYDPGTKKVSVTNPGDGNLQIRVKKDFADLSGNSAAADEDGPVVVIDRSAPTVSGLAVTTAGVRSNHTVAASTSDAHGPVVFHYQMSNSDSVPGSFTSQVANISSPITNLTLSDFEGTGYFHYYAVDNLGNESTKAHLSMSLDTKAPRMTGSVSTSRPDFNDTSMSLSFNQMTELNPDKYQLQIIRSNDSTVIAGYTDIVPSGTTTKTFAFNRTAFGSPNLQNGVNYTFKVRALDTVAQTSDEIISAASTYDTIAPIVTAINVNGQSHPVRTRNAGNTFNFTFSGAAPTEMAIGTGSCPTTGWEAYAGSHGFSVPAVEQTLNYFVNFRDAAGNTTNCVGSFIAITYDSTAPANVTITSQPTATAGVHESTPSLTFTTPADADLAEVKVRLLKHDGSTFVDTGIDTEIDPVAVSTSYTRSINTEVVIERYKYAIDVEDDLGNKRTLESNEWTTSLDPFTSGDSTITTLTYTGGNATYALGSAKVIGVRAWGGGGGGGERGPGGSGGFTAAVFNVEDLGMGVTQLLVQVAGRGLHNLAAGGGGGASRVFIGNTTSVPLVIAGGGGGGGEVNNATAGGGNGGGLVGGTTNGNVGVADQSGPGNGGQSYATGSSGANVTTYSSGSYVTAQGGFPDGGYGRGRNNSDGRGGGGGGYWGGGAPATGDVGGGGGSGFIRNGADPNLSLSVRVDQTGYQTESTYGQAGPTDGHGYHGGVIIYKIE